MNFAFLSGLWLALIAVPVVVLYILKIKRHARVVPYLRMWADLVADKQFTTLFQRLQRFLSLLLQLLIATCLVLALASLTLSDSFLQEDSVVLVVDSSASMQGLENEDAAEPTSRFEAAIARARALVEGRSAEDEFAVIAAGPAPEVVQGFTKSTLRLREALDRLAVTKATGDLRDAVQLAEDLLQGKEHRRVVLMTDTARGHATELARAEHVHWERIGASVGNIAIERFQARKNHAMGTDYLLVVVTNHGQESASVEVEIWIQGSLKKLVPLELAAGATETETLELDVPEGGFARAVLRHVDPVASEETTPADPTAEPARDGLDLDDVAWAVVPPARLYRVLLVARDEAEQEPFKAALGALGSLVDRDGSGLATPDQWAGLAADAIDAYDLVLFVNWAPETLPARGRFFAINALPGGLPATVRGVETEPVIKELASRHAMNRFLVAGSLRPSEARPLDLTGGEAFMTTGGGPVGVVFRERERRSVYLGLDVLSDLFFLRVAFPILLRNALGWMHEEETELLRPTYRPGDVIRPRVSLADATVTVGWRHAEEDASGNAEVAVVDGKFYFGDTAEPGRYFVKTAARDYLTTVNLFDRGESDLTMPDVEPSQDELGIERSGFLFGRDLWPLLLLIAAGLSVLEWGLFHRRLTE